MSTIPVILPPGDDPGITRKPYKETGHRAEEWPKREDAKEGFGERPIFGTAERCRNSVRGVTSNTNLKSLPSRRATL